MRTKNAKRLWPVPATLAVVALAAFLAFGLMATNGAQPAAAQSDADCTATNAGVAAASAADTPDITVPRDCSTTDSTAVVALQGAIGLEDEDELTVYVYAKDGTIQGGQDTKNLWDYDATAAEAPATPEPTKFSGVKLTIPAATQGLSSGAPTRAKGMITVAPAAGKPSVTLYIYYQDGVPISTFEHDTDNTTDPVSRINSPTGNGTLGVMTITFLGTPAVGKDGGDRNKIIEDFQQCVLNAEDSNGEFDVGTTNEDGDTVTCDPAGSSDDADQLDTDDKPEIRSNLVAFTDRTVGENNTVVLDGMEVDHKLDGETITTIYAVIEDAAGNALPGVEVVFTATLAPSDLDLDLKLTRAVDTRTAVVANPANDDDLIVIATEAADGLGITLRDTSQRISGDAVAMRVIDDLPTDQGYRIEVAVTAEGVNIGTINIARDGDPHLIKGDTFNMACLDVPPDANAGDYTDATVDLDNKDCAPQDRYGDGDVVIVKAHLEDNLETVIEGDLSASLDGEDDALTEISVDTNDPPAMAWIYVVDTDADNDATALGGHMITISHDDNDDDINVADKMIDFAVAGPPVEYMFVDPAMNIALGDRATFTVRARDTNMGVPNFITTDDATTDADDRNNTVDVVVPDIAESLVRGRMLDNGVLTLDADTGMGSFTIYAPANAPAGSTARIFVSAGDVEITHTVTFGDPDATPDPMDDRFTAMYTVMADSPSSGMVEVSWVTTQPISLVMLMDDQGMVAAWDVALLALGSSAQFSEIQAGEYQVVVFSLTAGDFSNGGLAFGSVTVE